MDGHEIRLLDQVGRVNRPWSEAQVRDGDGAGLLRVIDEVSLSIVGCVLANDLDRVLVGTNRAIGAQTVEYSPHDIVLIGGEVGS